MFKEVLIEFRWSVEVFLGFSKSVLAAVNSMFAENLRNFHCSLFLVRNHGYYMIIWLKIGVSFKELKLKVNAVFCEGGRKGL